MFLFKFQSKALLGWCVLVSYNLMAMPHQHASEHSHEHAQPQASAVVQQGALAALSPKATTLYTCSMHPHFRSENPNDRCPICGMSLIPVEQDDEPLPQDDGAVLRLSPRANALLQPELTPVRRQQVSSSLNLVGRLADDQSRIQTISAWTSGRIEQLYLNTTAVNVRAGEPMVEIFNPELIVIQQELIQAKQLGNTKGVGLPAASTLDAARRRLRILGVPASQIEQILQSETLQDSVTISAPISGLVLERMVNSGAYVNTGQPLFTVLGLETLWLELEAFEPQLTQIKPGQSLSVTLLALPGETLHATVQLLEPQVDAYRRTVRVRAVLPNRDGRLKPGMLAKAKLQTEVPEVLLIPVSAALLTGERALVYVKLDDERPTYAAREVTLGRRFGDSYEVLSGLNENDLVVSRGALRLDSELQIRGLPSMMAPAGGGSDPHAGHRHGSSTKQDMTAASVSREAAPALTAPVVVPQIDFRLDDTEHQAILAAYQQLYLALTEDNLSEWQASTERFQQVIAQINWPSNFPRIVTALQYGHAELAEVSNLDEARVQFYQHNLGLLRLAELGVLAPGWYRAFCPMARNGEGAAWLQPQQNILNPYFGAMMLRCGEVEQQFGTGANHEH